MLKNSEIYRLVNDYIGVSNGYLNRFSYRTHYEFYLYYCDLEINVGDYEPGTTREKFIRILKEATPIDQAKIIRGVFKKFLVTSFDKNEQYIAEMVEEDRRLKLAGYEIYRFGGYEFWNREQAKEKIVNFFSNLFKLYSIT